MQITKSQIPELLKFIKEQEITVVRNFPLALTAKTDGCFLVKRREHVHLATHNFQEAVVRYNALEREEMLQRTTL